MLVLAGSSGRIDVARARLLARQGATALALGYFGGPGQPDDIVEIPLETVTAGLDHLQERGADRLAMVGMSRGAEAALLVACRDDRVAATVALAPTSVVWPELIHLPTPRSSWTWRGEPLTFVPWDRRSFRGAFGTDPPVLRKVFEASLARYPQRAIEAAIPVEEAAGHLVLVAGGDDRVWPSHRFANELAARRRAHGRPVELVVRPDAGHRPVFPGETAPPPDARMARGGSPEADAALGADAWPRVVGALRPDP